MRTKIDQVQNLPITTKIINKLYSTFIFSVSAVHFCDLIDVTENEVTAKTCRQISFESLYIDCLYFIHVLCWTLVREWDDKKVFVQKLLENAGIVSYFRFINAQFYLSNLRLINCCENDMTPEFILSNHSLLLLLLLGNCFSICGSHNYILQCLGS